MTIYKRAIIENFESKLLPNKVIVLLGARRVGKTKFIEEFFQNYPQESVLKLNGEDINDIRLLETRTVANYKRLLNNIEYLIIDEAQNIPEIGLILKLIVDNIPDIKVVATGSSMFDLSNKLGEPLVGRKNTIYIFPLSQIEFNEKENLKLTHDNLEKRLVLGAYPELEQYDYWKDKEDYLYEIINSYLLKDILVFDGIMNSDKIYNLLRLIAYQVGKEVSLQELGNTLQMSKNTVDKYLDLLSKVFILFKVDGFSRNLRKEITKSKRWYFYDNGIRNALINNFNTLNNRNDVGELWENYILSERIKKQHYQKLRIQNYFWRTYDQQEIDWVEENSSSLTGYEIKWSQHKKSKIPIAFQKGYPDANYHVINPQNYLEFIS